MPNSLNDGCDRDPAQLCRHGPIIQTLDRWKRFIWRQMGMPTEKGPGVLKSPGPGVTNELAERVSQPAVNLPTRMLHLSVGHPNEWPVGLPYGLGAIFLDLDLARHP